jgi:hypothetical protein
LPATIWQKKCIQKSNVLRMGEADFCSFDLTRFFPALPDRVFCMPK